jgi:hypothetical protein
MVPATCVPWPVLVGGIAVSAHEVGSVHVVDEAARHWHETVIDERSHLIHIGLSAAPETETPRPEMRSA